MLENLMNGFIQSRAELIDRLTRSLLSQVDIHIDETYGNFDTLIVADELSRKGYKLRVKSEGESVIIGLYKIEDLYESLYCGYRLEVEYDDISVSIVADKIETKN